MNESFGELNEEGVYDQESLEESYKALEPMQAKMTTSDGDSEMPWRSYPVVSPSLGIPDIIYGLTEGRVRPVKSLDSDEAQAPPRRSARLSRLLAEKSTRRRRRGYGKQSG